MSGWVGVVSYVSLDVFRAYMQFMASSTWSCRIGRAARTPCNRCFLFGLCVTFAHGGCVGWVVIRFESDRGTLDPAVEYVYVSWSAIIVEGGNKDLSAIARWQRGAVVR